MSIVYSKKKFIKLLSLIIFIIISILEIPAWYTPDNTEIFSRYGTDASSGSFYNPDLTHFQKNHDPKAIIFDQKLAWNRGTSGNGLIRVERDGQPLVAFEHYEKNIFFKILPDDNICPLNINVSSFSCIKIKQPGLLLNHTGSDPWWSTRLVDPNVGIKFPIRSSSEDELFITSRNHLKRNFIVKTHNGLNIINLRKISKIRINLIISGIIFSALCAFVFFQTAINYKNIVNTVKSVYLFAILIIVQVIFQYISVFPAIFSADFVIAKPLIKGFTIWYSSAYMIEQYIFYPLLPLFIQFPQVILYICVSIYLCSHLIKIKNGKYWLTLYFFVQLLSPTMFAMLFVPQRIYSAAEILFSAFIIIGVRLSQNRTPGKLGYIMLVSAALMRPEYCIFVIFSIIYELYKTRKIISLSLLITKIILVFFIINIIVPTIMHKDVHSITRNYKLMSMLDIIRPYINCKTLEPEDISLFSSIGGIDSYCNFTEDKFYWGKVSKIDQKQVNIFYKNIKKHLIKDIINDPRPEIIRISERLTKLSLWPTYEIFDRYQNKNLIFIDDHKNFHIRPTYYPLFADTLDLVKDYKWQSFFSAKITNFYYKMSVLFPMGIWVCFLLFIVPFIIRKRTIIFINFTVISILITCAFASPTSVINSYLILAWVWGILVLPLYALIYQKAVKTS